MTHQQIDLRERLTALIGAYSGRIPLLESIKLGTLPLDHLKSMAARVYAETRAAIQVKFPERMRICPINAIEIRRFWWQQFADESGDFKPECDHATLLTPTCYSLGLSKHELHEEYGRYLPTVEWMRNEPVSMETTLREAARMFVEEAIFADEANPIGDALREHYNVPEDSLQYFRVHAIADAGHSQAGLEMLTISATTPTERDLVLTTVQQSLEHFPIWADDLRHH